MHRITGSFAGAVGLALASLVVNPLVASAAPTLQRLSTDPFHNGSSQHQTEVEPDIASWGSTLVGAFQVGRVAARGAADIGWATSTDGGSTWSHGFLPGLTTFAGAGHNSAVSDPAVAYDPAHSRWLIVSLPISGAGDSVAVNSSPDGLHWSKPVQVAKPSGLDKTWITCDGTSTSRFYGHCYAEWDNAGLGDVVQMSTSKDGGQTWSTPFSPPGAAGLGGEPLAQPNGTVVVPFIADVGNIEAYRSIDGGTTWTAPVVIASATAHLDPGGFRGGPLPSASIDAGGRVYVTWESCLHESGCKTNDAVLSSSTDGIIWSAPLRVPTNPAGSSVDVAIPGIGVDRSTQGATAHLGIVYYDFSNVNCTVSRPA